jgi:DNA-binding NarL/FixJ family response regulator
MSKPEEAIRVMLADDHRVLIGSLKALLERHGCEVVGEATTGEEALAVAAKVRPQVIVMDLEMPGTGGLAAAHRNRMCSRRSTKLAWPATWSRATHRRNSSVPCARSRAASAI